MMQQGTKNLQVPATTWKIQKTNVLRDKKEHDSPTNTDKIHHNAQLSVFNVILILTISF